MAQLIVGAAFAVAGAAVGIPPGIGFAIGSMVGGALGPGQHTYGPRLVDLKTPKIEYGAKWPRLYGRVRTAGIVLWQSDLEEVATESSTGKGGPSVTSTTFTYYRSVIVGLAEFHFGASIKPIAISRIWRNKKLIWSALSDSSASTISASASSEHFDDVRFYDGNASQLPDPIYEAAVGAANAIGWRYRSTVFLERVNCAGSDQIGLFEFEVVTAGSIADGFQERFANGLSDYSTPDAVFSIVTGDHGPALQIDSGGIVPTLASSIARAAAATSFSEISLRVRIDTLPSGSNCDDAPILTVKNSGTTVFAFIPAREQAFDPTQAPFANVAGVLEAVGGPLVVGTWYTVSAVIASPTTVVVTITNDSTNTQHSTHTFTGVYTTWTSTELHFQNQGGIGADVQPTATYDDIVLGASTVSPETVDLADIVAQEHSRANGGVTSEFDVSALEGKEVLGYACAGSGREAIEALRTAFYFDAICRDKVYYVLRGGASVATIPWESTGVGVDRATDAPYVGPARDNDQELARKVALTYTNLDADYDNGTVEGDRLVGTSNRVDQIQLPIVLQPAKAQGIVDTAAADGRLASQGSKVTLDDAYGKLEPTDIVTLTDEDGNTYRNRIVESLYSAGVCELTVVLDDASILSDVGITSETYSPVIDIVVPGDIELVLLDMPILQDADNSPGPYAVVKPETGTVFRAGGVYSSIDDVTFASEASVSVVAVFGTTVTALDDYTGGNVFDVVSTVRVDVGDGALSSTTRDAALDNGANLMLIGSEVVQPLNCDLVSPGIYDLSVFLRGRRGTEWAMVDHVMGETVVLLDRTKLTRIDQDLSQIDTLMHWKGVAGGKSLTSVPSFTFTDTGVALKPFAPVNLRVDRDTANVTAVTWDRRTRLSGEFLNGSDVPLGEASESYAVELYDTLGALVSTQTVTTARATFEALAPSFNLAVPTDKVRNVAGLWIGTVDAYPSSGTGTSLRAHDTSGVQVGGAFIGQECPSLINVGSELYAAVINGPFASYVYRVSAGSLAAGGVMAATYPATLAADPQGLAYDGTDIWVAQNYSGNLKRLDATTLAVIATHALTGGIGPMVHDSGSLYICHRGDDEIIEWDIAGAAEVRRIPCISRPWDILITNGMIFIAGALQIAVYDLTTGDEITATTGGAGARFRNALAETTDSVVACDQAAGQLIFFDSTTGVVTNRVGVDSVWGIAGSDGDTLFAAIHTGGPSGSAMTTRVLAPTGSLAGYTARVYQVGAAGRGYPAEITL